MENPRHAHLQWAKGRDIDWDSVLDGTSAANRFLLVTALTRKADLARTVKALESRSFPETFVVDPEDSTDEDEDDIGGDLDETRDASKRKPLRVPRAVRALAGAWALKASESNCGDDIVFFDAGDAGDVRRAETFMNASRDRSCAANAPWVVQRYVDSVPIKSESGKAYKFHLRAHALVVGDARAYAHDDVVGLVASSPVRAGAPAWTNLEAHATNHKVRWKREGRETDMKRETRDCEDPPPRSHLSLEDACLATGFSPGSADSNENVSLRAERLRDRVRAVVAETLAAARETKTGFRPIDGGSFELFGFDFLVDQETGAPRLLEVNADPNMAVFGEGGESRCASMLRDALSIVLPPIEKKNRARDLDPVRREDEEETYPSRVGGFVKVWSAFSRAPVASSENRRRVQRLVSLTAGLAFRVAAIDDPTRRACVPFGSPGGEGAIAALRRAGGWHIERDHRAPMCAFQWAPHRLVRWDRIMDWREGSDEKKKIVANHHYARGCLFRPADLSRALDAFVPRTPETVENRFRGLRPSIPTPSASGKTRRSLVRAVAFVAGPRTNLRVAVRREMDGFENVVVGGGGGGGGGGGDADALGANDASSASFFAAVAEAVKRAFEAAASAKNKPFLPFANCFETYVVTALVETRDGSAYRARAVRVRDAFEGTRSAGENAEGEVWMNHLADAATTTALRCFFGDRNDALGGSHHAFAFV